MGNVVMNASVSVDGFIADEDDDEEGAAAERCPTMR